MQFVMTCEPLELEYLYGAAREHLVEIYDGMTDRRNLKSLIKRFRPDVLAVSAYITHVAWVKRLCRFVKRCSPDTLCMAGGGHAEVCPEHFFSDTLDLVFYADTLLNFKKCIQLLSEGKDFHHLPGIGYPALPSTTKAPVPASIPGTPCFMLNEGKPLDPDQLPSPERILLQKQPEKYFYLYHKPCALLKTSYSCPHQCNFCFCTKMNLGVYRERSLQLVMEEIRDINVKTIFIIDDNFLVSRKRVEEFCTLITKEKIRKKWIIYGRVDFIAGNEDLIAALVRLGLVAIISGLEAIDDTDLKQMNKQQQKQQIERAITICERYKLDLIALFIIDPDWSISKIRRLGRWVVAKGLYQVTYSTLTIFPKTDLWEEFQDRIRPGKADFALWDLLHLTTPSRHGAFRYYYELSRLYRVTIFSPKAREVLFKQLGVLRGSLFGLKVVLAALEFMLKLFLIRQS
jgi:radical SAM superfamily enzyme YgiQ (UPF0313 family)